MKRAIKGEKNKSVSIWITWEKHRRTETLASKLDIPLFCLRSSLPSYIKRIWLLACTFVLLLKWRPNILFVQNPSAFLTVEAIFLKFIFRYLLVVDAHNAGVYPFEPHQKKFQTVFPFLHKNSDLTVVTNSTLAQIVEGNGGNAFVLPDALPFIASSASNVICEDCFIVVFVCSFATDEPYKEVFEASEGLPDNCKIYVTGDYHKIGTGQPVENDNIIFTGFLDDDDYVSLLKNSCAIMDLTEFNDCLVCGAYEGVACGVPLILSDTPVNRDWFTKGVIYTNHSANNITGAIYQAKERHDKLKVEIKLLKGEIEEKWTRNFSELNEKLGWMSCR